MLVQQRWFTSSGVVHNLAASGRYFYVADDSCALRIIDISAPEQPREIAHLETYRAVDVHVAGSYAYIADDWAGMRVVDISDPSAPRVVGHMDTPGNAERITVAGQCVEHFSVE